MSVNNPDFRAAVIARYDSFAALARSAAAGETLENVRQKHLTSAISWEQLAVNGRKMEADRARRAAGQIDGGDAAEIAASETIAARLPRSRTLIG